MPNSALIIQTAFIGDVILTLPLVQELSRLYPGIAIDVIAVPRAAETLTNHPAIRKIILFDKRGTDSGISGIVKLGRTLRYQEYEVALIPHRSVRSAALAYLAKIPRRIGFTTSSGNWMFTDCVPYSKNSHEVSRNLSLLNPLGYLGNATILPNLYPSGADRVFLDGVLENVTLNDTKLIAIAPGTVWKTKQWLPERFALLAHKLAEKGYTVVLLGGKEDEELAREIISGVPTGRIVSCIGKLSLLQSAELLRRCDVLVSNDSAPMHLAVAMRTPVVAIFGATIPGFGFAPIGEYDIVLETPDLPCRPCSIHGGHKCPITTFDCMNMISVDRVLHHVEALASIKRSKE